jgi:hypothetical protein
MSREKDRRDDYRDAAECESVEEADVDKEESEEAGAHSQPGNQYDVTGVIRG